MIANVAVMRGGVLTTWPDVKHVVTLVNDGGIALTLGHSDDPRSSITVGFDNEFLLALFDVIRDQDQKRGELTYEFYQGVWERIKHVPESEVKRG